MIRLYAFALNGPNLSLHYPFPMCPKTYFHGLPILENTLCFLIQDNVFTLFATDFLWLFRSIRHAPRISKPLSIEHSYIEITIVF